MIPKETNEPAFFEAIEEAVGSKEKAQKTIMAIVPLINEISDFALGKAVGFLGSYEWGKSIAKEFKKEIINGTFATAFKKRITQNRLEKDYVDFVKNAPKKKYIEQPRLKIEKKDVLEELIHGEIAKLDEILQVLEDLQIVVPDEGYELSESDAFCWIEDKPSRDEQKRVLTALGYDVSKL